MRDAAAVLTALHLDAVAGLAVLAWASDAGSHGRVSLGEGDSIGCEAEWGCGLHQICTMPPFWAGAVWPSILMPRAGLEPARELPPNGF